MVRSAFLAGFVALALCACSDPTAPDKEQPPEPKAAADAAKHDDLARAVQEPMDRARDVQATLDASAASRRDAVAAAETGEPAAEAAP
jgi:PBP1b-binding outer membrane lipoprotein LpoB